MEDITSPAGRLEFMPTARDPRAQPWTGLGPAKTFSKSGRGRRSGLRLRSREPNSSSVFLVLYLGLGFSSAASVKHQRYGRATMLSASAVRPTIDMYQFLLDASGYNCHSTLPSRLHLSHYGLRHIVHLDLRQQDPRTRLGM
jgi:hypothetical protein